MGAPAAWPDLLHLRRVVECGDEVRGGGRPVREVRRPQADRWGQGEGRASQTAAAAIQISKT